MLVLLTPFWRGVSVKTSWKVHLTSLPSKRQMNLSSSSQTRSFPLGSSLTHWKKGHNRLQHLKNNLPGFFLNGTWSWPRGWRSDISSCPGVDGGSTRGVDIWLSLSNLLHCPNRNSRNNLWRNTWSIPNDPTGCRFLFCLKLGQDGQDREKGWV